MKTKNFALLLMASFVFAMPVAHAASLSSFSEDFSTDLSRWTGKQGGSHFGVITYDSDLKQNVLAFSNVNYAGDIFTVDTVHSESGQFKISFDYRGGGGFVGLDRTILPDSSIGTGEWVAGDSSYPFINQLNTDGQWHHYDYLVDFLPFGKDAHIMLEDFSGSVSGHGARFANIQLTAVPIPSAAWLMLSAITGIGMIGRKKQV